MVKRLPEAIMWLAAHVPPRVAWLRVEFYLARAKA
jgi:hypothetical protein